MARIRTYYTSALVTGFVVFSLRVTAQDKMLSRWYRQKDYFKLERQFKKDRVRLPDSLRLFYEAVLHNAFNRPSKSDQDLKTLRSRFVLTDSLKKVLLNLEADNAIKLYDYRRAAKAYQRVIDECKPDSTERADLQNSVALWGAIADVPAQVVIQKRDAVLRWKKDKIGLVQVPVHTGTDSCDLVFDTGANISVITESSAKKNAYAGVPGQDRPGRRHDRTYGAIFPGGGG